MEGHPRQILEATVIKPIVALTLTLSSMCVMSCTQPPPAQSSTTGQAASPAQAAPDTSKPSSDTAASQPTAAAAPTAAAPAQPAPPPEPAAPPAPEFREVTIPAGTALSVTLLSSVASNKSKVEDPVKGSIAKAVIISGVTALPVGTQLLGSVTEAAESGRVKGKASVAFRFNRLVVGGETLRVQTATVQRTAAADTKSDVKKGGLGAGAGAIVGGVIGGGKGAAIGAVAGGAGTVLATKGSEVEIPSGTVVKVLVQDPITVRVAVK
jgi:hypothetical protein